MRCYNNKKHSLTRFSKKTSKNGLAGISIPVLRELGLYYIKVYRFQQSNMNTTYNTHDNIVCYQYNLNLLIIILTELDYISLCYEKYSHYNLRNL